MARQEVDTCLWKNEPLNLNDPELKSAISEARSSMPDPWKRGDWTKAGLIVWKISKFRAVPWPFEDHGHFYMDEVFLVLNVRRDATIGEVYNLHIWVGRNASLVDYATAVWKMSELDEHFSYEALMHREVEGAESDLFKSYFNPITVWKGTSDDSFKVCRRTGGQYTSRLLQYYQPDDHVSNIRIKEMYPSRKLEPTSIYILDLGDKLIVCIGALCKSELVHGGLSYVGMLKANRGAGVVIETLNHAGGKGENGHAFYTYLTQDTYMRNVELREDKTISRLSLRKAEKLTGPVSTLVFKISSKNQKTELKKVKEGAIVLKDLEKHNMCLIDSKYQCFLWINKKAVVTEKRLAMEHAHDYLRETNHSLVPVTVLRDGQSTAAFQRVFIPPSKNDKPGALRPV